MNIYITSDDIGGQTGAGQVCQNELQALRGLGSEVLLLNPIAQQNPFDTEKDLINELQKHDLTNMKLCHIYAGTYPNTVKFLKSNGIKVSYTAAAHDKELSIHEHKKLLGHYPFEHLEKDWDKYLQPYLDADVVICPSHHSKNVMHQYGCKSIVVVAHGHNVKTHVKPFPKRFALGYLGAIGPDKGLTYLLEAWDKLAYEDSLLVLAGKYTPYLIHAVRNMKNKNVWLRGWVNNIEDFYKDISIYVQPSVTEGFGIEVLEAMAHGRPVIVSDGAGSSDCVTSETGFVVPKCNSDALANAINTIRYNFTTTTDKLVEQANKYTWDSIREEYKKVWREYL